MRIIVASVGRPGKLFLPGIREYEERAARYWKLEIAEVKAARKSQNRPVSAVRQQEGERLRAAVPAGTEIVALTRGGEGWSSVQLAKYLGELALRGDTGTAFLIGGAFGLDRALVKEAAHRLSLSTVTMPHEMARLILAEQLYRAGTILRGEPYHKG